MSTVAGWFKNKEPQAMAYIDQILALYNAGLLSDIEARDYLITYLPTIVRSNLKYKVKAWKPEHLKSLLSSGNLTADQCQTILYALADGLLLETLVDLITFDASNSFVSSNTTITGTNRYNNLVVLPAVTLTADGQPSVIIAKRIQVAGSIVKSTTGGAGGAAGVSGAGAGGAGGGGLIIFTDEIINSGTISANGAGGGGGSTVTATASGGAGGAGVFGVIIGLVGKGGDGGSYYGAYRGLGGYNGGGGGGFYSDSVGGSGDGCSYSALVPSDIIKAVVDWYLVNVIGKTPTTTKSFPSFYGSGGGGGGARDGSDASGGGGGGGGELIIFVRKLQNTGTISANGGGGGNGGTEGSYDSGGGGGGGGLIYLLYEELVTLGTISVSGGAAGTGDYNGVAGTAGSYALIPIT